MRIKNLIKMHTPPFLRGQARSAMQILRMTGAGKRALPHFIILGAQRAGTTSLYSYIAQHPRIRKASRKEVHYFDANHSKGSLWYRSHFPTRSGLCSTGSITGESSPHYLFHPHVPQRILDLLPQARLMILLRNPTQRAISHYFHETALGHERLPIQEALETEEHRLEPEIQRTLVDPSYNSFAYGHFSYKRRGIYVDQVQRFLKLFPSRQILILASEDLFSRPRETLKKVFEFLGVDPTFIPQNLRPKNVGTQKETVPAGVFDYLNTYFMPHNERLFKCVGHVFPW